MPMMFADPQPGKRRNGTLPAGLLLALLVGSLALLATLGPSGGQRTDRPEIVTRAGSATGVETVKARPPLDGAPSTQSGTDTNFLYAAAVFSHGPGVVTGARAAFSVHRPAVYNDRHSLAELAVTSAGNDRRDIVEVGWTVDPGLNGDLEPHLFVFHWVEGTPTCYNACGFVRTGSASVFPGMVLAVGRFPQFAINHMTNPGRWAISMNNQVFGYFPDSLWGGRFTQPSGVVAFGEVAARGVPCAQMGNGAFPTASTGAQISLMAFLPLGTAPPATITISTVTNPSYYRAQKTSATAIRYGGPGGATDLPSLARCQKL